MSKAKLIELDTQLEKKSGGKEIEVQFNPETLKVNFSNQIEEPPNAGQSPGGKKGKKPDTSNIQFVGKGTTKLSLQLWFDVNAPLPVKQQGTTDVRELTKEVAYFITPQETRDKLHFTIPGVRFLWGTFQFDGFVESLDESLEFFSEEGRPLRASMALSLTQKAIKPYEFGKAEATANPPGVAGPSGAPAGTQPLAQAPAGSTLQSIAAAQGISNWQAIAAANGIENPRLLSPGQLIDLNASVPASVSVPTGGPVSVSGRIGVS